MPVNLTTRPNVNVVQPGAYSSVSIAELTNPPESGTPIVAILGEATGGKPNTPLYFQSPGILKNVMRSGRAYDGARFALKKGAPQVCVVRVNKGTLQGTLNVAGATGTLVKLTSIDYGTWVNAIKVEVTSGPIVTLKYTDSLGNVYKESWNFAGLESGTPTNAHIAEAINGQLFGYTASNFVTAAAEAGTGALKVAAAAPLTGGAEEAPEASTWTAALETLETQEISIIVPMTSEESVHALVQAHCEVMSSGNARKERTGVYGGATGETEKKQEERAAALLNRRSQLVWPGMNEYNSTGELVLWAPFYRAALIAGMHCALPDPATSLTHDETGEISVEKILSTAQGGPLDKLLLAGVTVCQPKPGGGVWVVDSLSTTNEAAGVFRDFHKTRSADYVQQYLRVNMEARYTGGKMLSGSLESQKIFAEQLLKELRANQIIRAFKEVTVEPGPQTGAIVTSTNSSLVNAPVMLIDTDKFIFIQVALQSPTTVSAGV